MLYVRETISLAANRGVLTFVLSGLSKISALPQMKVAWMVVNGPKSAVERALARLEVIADTYLSLKPGAGGPARHGAAQGHPDADARRSPPTGAHASSQAIRAAFWRARAGTRPSPNGFGRGP
jgi:aspartate/methionine/tyrosine aminotransferase